MNLKQILIKLKLKSRWLFNDLRGKAGWKGRPAHPCRRILLYHGIDQRGETQLNSRFLSQAELRRHFEWLQAECSVIPLAEQFSRGRSASRPEISLTFDDGYRNNFTEVLPLLEEFGFPATFFITAAAPTGRKILWTDLLDLDARLDGRPFIWMGERYYRNGRGFYISLRTAAPLKAFAKTVDLAAIAELESLLMERVALEEHPEWKPYWELMTEEELRTMGTHPLVELGVHGTTHCSLGALPHAEACAELADCKTWLESLGEAPVTTLSWPSGSYSPELVEAAAEMGLVRQLAGDYLHAADAEDARQAERLVINPHISFLNQREAILKGGYL